MRRFCIFVAVLCVAAQSLFAASPRERVREAATVIYVHGMTQEIADGEVGPEGIPYLLELLRDPDFVRRDNVVAFLAYLGYDSDAPELMRFLDDPPTDRETPEEFRARLLVPEALGRIASRGGVVARDLLNRLAGDESVREMEGMAPMVERGLSLMDATEPQPDPPEPVPDPDAIDANTVIHKHDLTHANHINTNSPMGDMTVDALLDDVTFVMSLENATNDTACCVQLTRSQPGGVFGTNGDGLDIITTAGEMNSVIGLGVARVKVVDYIGWCGGTGSNIIGCGLTPGKGLVVVRISGIGNEGKLWAHEYGHNTGLGHNPSAGFIMTGGLTPGNTRLSTSECNRYHFPSALAQAVVVTNGICEDNDGDSVMSSYDNCSEVPNGSQTDSDNDDVGNACDNCMDTPNPDQVDCDNDSVGDVCDTEIIIPPALDSVHFVSNDEFQWDPEPFRKNVYRGLYDGQTWVYNEEVVGVLNSETTWVDPEVPPSGMSFYYLVSLFNSCGETFLDE